MMSYAPYFRTPIFVNVGKNRKTSNENAVADYLSVIDKFRPIADAFVVNISSPNTQGLRELQSKENLQRLLTPIMQKVSHFEPTPVLIKLSPDMDQELLAETVMHCHDLGIDGYILTNTTLARHTGCPYPPEGGLSGAPLKDLSERALQTAINALGDKRAGKLIVSAGGIMSPQDVVRRLELGADLVQIYSALILHGPGFFHDVVGQYTDDNKHD